MANDIHPKTPVASLRLDYSQEEMEKTFPADLVAVLVGMSTPYIKTALGHSKKEIPLSDVLFLLNLDSFAETFIPRSQVPEFLLNRTEKPIGENFSLSEEKTHLFQGSVTDLVHNLAKESVNCAVTSPPYWGLRLYDKSFEVTWADGETCSFGNEQTPESYIRHTIEILYLLKSVLKVDGSVWWNVMDTYNTRTQIRENAVETLRAMQGLDERGWHDHAARRYSAGHSYLKDGEQCLIPIKIAERASRIGYNVKSVITWKKNGSMPETVQSRVTRELEYIIHLSLIRSPYFDKDAYLNTPVHLGGKNKKLEADKITDVWSFRTSTGKDGHGAQFPVELPGRCIALSTREGDVVLDPFMGAGTTALAALYLNRKCIGFDVSEKYINIAQQRIKDAEKNAVPLLTVKEELNGNGYHGNLEEQAPTLFQSTL